MMHRYSLFENEYFSETISIISSSNVDALQTDELLSNNVILLNYREVKILADIQDICKERANTFYSILAGSKYMRVLTKAFLLKMIRDCSNLIRFINKKYYCIHEHWQKTTQDETFSQWTKLRPAPDDMKTLDILSFCEKEDLAVLDVYARLMDRHDLSIGLRNFVNDQQEKLGEELKYLKEFKILSSSKILDAGIAS
ncbi:hypothetical protein QTN47_20180 [Danxiaibacter flavus]|uniref:Uncharacterized protein n=1 Tax=Danxiaibacter flavus TaxID=3049108 RepID=A0ABV3ZL66_9BACT|nr:hypothetical protein QNM32_20190 [Chitinophagaceae bacterium DXS]